MRRAPDWVLFNGRLKIRPKHKNNKTCDNLSISK